MSLFLIEDVRGLCSQKLYGRTGDPVLLVADHYDMLIVEGNGERFPVRKTAVSNCIDEKPKTLVQSSEITEPEAVKPAPMASGRWKTKQTKSVNLNPTLF